MHIYIYARFQKKCGYIINDNVRRLTYTQFAIQDSGLFGPNPWKLLARIVYVFP